MRHKKANKAINKSGGKILSLIFTFFHLIHFQNSALAKNGINFTKNKEILSQVNKKLDLLNNLVQKQSINEICKESSTLVRLIRLNASALSSIEPQHNWEEIQDALFEMSGNYCTKSPQIINNQD